MNALQALVGSLGILLASPFTMPLAGALFGIPISVEKGAGIGVFLFVLRFFWLWGVNSFFYRRRQKRLVCDAGPTCWPYGDADFPRTKPS